MARDSETVEPVIPYGRRLIATTIDEFARASPDRTYASIPKSDTDLTLGFRDITYAELAAAIDRTAYWLDEHLPPSSRSASSSVASLPSADSKNSKEDGSTEENDARQTFTYFGPRDLRYILFLVAAMKTDRRMLNTSPMGSLEAQAYLANASGCRVFLYAEDLGGIVPEYVREIPQQVEGSTTMTVPSFEDLFFGKGDSSQQHYPYEKSWDEARRDEVAIYHTSGSSGFPKLVPYTNEMLARVDTWNLLEDVDGMTTSKEFYANKRIWASIPIFHLAGALISLPCALFFSTTPVFTSPTALPTAALFAHLHAAHTQHSSALDGIFVPPALLEDIVRRSPSPPPSLTALPTIIFGGAPLAPAAGAALAPHGSLRTCIGSTEGSYWPTLQPPAQHWDHIALHPAVGASFEERADGLYELVIPRSAGSEKYTNFFCAAERMGGGGGGGGEGQVWRTKDLFSRCADDAGLWKYRGRTDDLVVLTGEVKMYAGEVEERVRCHPLVRHALVGGYGRKVPFLLLEVAGDRLGPGVVEEVWPAVEEANRDILPKCKLRRELTFVAGDEKPFVRLGKGSVDRRGTLARYEKEIEEMYERWEE
ncbi:hypothetical protein SLS58_007349 [Diplodia intermedia]|uniref:AMP-dependent synthetase/ligase domain-containing protein n=1 Tax=Diplodia intermedia TaxID=856260 RepID=A0ABR3TL32_9PEZI